MVWSFLKWFDQLKKEKNEQPLLQEMTVILEAQQILEDVKSESNSRAYIHSPLPLKKHHIKTIWHKKQEQIPLIIYFLADNFNFGGISDIYLFFELWGNIWNRTHDSPSYKWVCVFFFFFGCIFFALQRLFIIAKHEEINLITNRTGMVVSFAVRTVLK